MKIATFAESNQDLNVAIEAAEDRAATVLQSLGRDELIQLTAQTIVEFSDLADSFYSHIITVVYE